MRAESTLTFAKTGLWSENDANGLVNGAIMHASKSCLDTAAG